MLVGVVAHLRNQRASGLACLFGVYLMASGVSVEVMTVFNKLHLGVSYGTLSNWFKKVADERKRETAMEVCFVSIYSW